MNELMNDYLFSDEKYIRIKRTKLGAYIPQSNDDVVITRAHITDGTLYITHSDLQAGSFAILTTAASAEHEAMVAALSLVELCVRELFAVAINQGIYIRPVLSYPSQDIGDWS